MSPEETADRSVSESLTVFRLPRSHWHCTLAGFRWDLTRPPELQRAYAQFLEGVEQRTSPHLILCGSAGCGKTHLGVVAYRWAVARWGTIQATWLSVPDFCDAVKDGYDQRGSNLFAEYSDALRLVVMDDIFGRDLTPHEASAIVYRLINVAYQNETALLITMNQKVSEIQTRFAGHEASRILANATVVNMTADVDYRRRK